MKEARDCTVFAWCNTFDAPYQMAHRYLQIHGRRNKLGMYTHEIKAALEACKKARVKIGPYDKRNKITVNQFCIKHPVGRYYVCVRGHAFCIKDGVVHDWKHGPRRQINFAARVYLEGEI
ncbi:MAG: hypothetical protein [Caudoviricetes sp.]|nr:MAG: hypothetical protein [Caudoviricetes sp.]